MVFSVSGRRTNSNALGTMAFFQSRDRKKHKSPNAAHTEAVMAGALDVQLAGDAWYFGKLVRKPFIGDGIRPIERQDIRRACRLEYATALLQLLVFGALKAAVLFML